MVKVWMGQRELEMGSKYLTELRTSNDILHDANALQERIKEEGYLFIRGFHQRERVLSARTALLNSMQNMGRLAPGTLLEDGIIGPDNKGAFFGGAKNVADLPELLNVVNAAEVMSFFDRFYAGESMTYDYKWVRAVGNGESTGAHYDIVYMGRGTPNVHTLWTPLGDVPLDMGPLALCLGSNQFEKIKQTYGQMDVDRDNVVGWFSNDPIEVVDKFGGQWATASFEAGDALIFGMYMMHGSLTNTTDRYRFSADTRYQLKSEPIDERWVGKKPKAHYAWNQGETVPMEEARKKWGIN